jgi:hypothetical protein
MKWVWNSFVCGVRHACNETAGSFIMVSAWGSGREWLRKQRAVQPEKNNRLMILKSICIELILSCNTFRNHTPQRLVINHKSLYLPQLTARRRNTTVGDKMVHLASFTFAFFFGVLSLILTACIAINDPKNNARKESRNDTLIASKTAKLELELIKSGKENIQLKSQVKSQVTELKIRSLDLDRTQKRLHETKESWAIQIDELRLLRKTFHKLQQEVTSKDFKLESQSLELATHRELAAVYTEARMFRESSDSSMKIQLDDTLRKLLKTKEKSKKRKDEGRLLQLRYHDFQVELVNKNTELASMSFDIKAKQREIAETDTPFKELRRNFDSNLTVLNQSKTELFQAREQNRKLREELEKRPFKFQAGSGFSK